ncbi:MAG: SIS domain-containing protein [Hyphomicrobiales bacterium]
MISGSPNLLEHITRSLDALRKSDRKVAQKILDDPTSATELKLADLAKLADVSEPTVIRFCSAIGCDGFQDMKIKLARSLAFGLSTSQVEISDNDDVETVVGKIFDFNLTSLDWVRSKLDLEALSAAVEVLNNAKNIHFIGLGASSIVAIDAQQKFPLFGVPCSAIVDSHQMLIAAAMMREGDVLVAISNSGATKEVAQTTRAAKERGAKTIGITGSNSPLLQFCDVGLLVETLENTDQYTPQISRVAALVIVDILSTIVAFKKAPDDRLRVADMKRFLADVRSTGLL